MKGKGARHTCPKCDSQNISASDGNFGAYDATCTVECVACGMRWFEYFKAETWEEL